MGKGKGSQTRKFFAKIANGFVWIGKEIGKAASWLPAIVQLSDDVKADAATLLPALAQVVDDVAQLAKAAVADSAHDIASAEGLVAAIVTATKSNALNIADDEVVVASFAGFIKTVTASTNYADALTAVKTLVLDYDRFGASAKTALAQLEKDVCSGPVAASAARAD
jgi:hypothetical protein